MGQERRQFTDEFKRGAVALLASSGRPLIQIAAELRIAPSMLHNWRDGAEGGLYLAVILNLFTRKVVGAPTSPCNPAAAPRNGSVGLIHHSCLDGPRLARLKL